MKYFTISLYLLTIISLIIQCVSGAKCIYSYCSIHEKFTSNEPYETNLRELMSYFSNKIHPNGWFSLGSKGHDMQRTHGLALCGINVSAIDCKRYVEDSSYEIRQSCPYSRIERPYVEVLKQHFIWSNTQTNNFLYDQQSKCEQTILI